MTRLFCTLAPVKTARPARKFGQGLLASRPTYRTDHSAADEAWLAADNARRLDDLVDELHAERDAVRLMEAGLASW